MAGEPHDVPPDLTRRDAVKAASLLLGMMAMGALPGCSTREQPPARRQAASAPFTADDEVLLTRLADTILPDTAASPGAAAAGCGPLLRLWLNECATVEEQQRAKAGLDALRQRAPQFATRPAAERESMLRTVDAEARTATTPHWFTLLHELSVRAYFATEVGQTRALRYVMEPGGVRAYRGCVPLGRGQPAWA